MKAGAAQPLTRVPSRPSFSKPPFARPHHPHNIPPVRPTLEGPSTQDRPIEQRPVEPNRPLEQDLRPNRPGQERRSQERRHPEGSRAGRGRGPGRRRRPDRPAHEPQEDEIYDRMVTVSGFPKYTRIQDLLHAFMYYGHATVERIVGSTATILFAGPEEAEEAVRFSQMHYVYGHRLTVEPYTGPTEPQQAPRQREANKDRQKGPTVDPNTLSWEGSFDTQLNELLTAVRLTQSDLQELKLLYQDLNAVLQKSWPGCQTIPFGSITTGLGVKSSDVDCFILLPARPDLPPRHHAVPRARRLLAAHPTRFTHIVPIPNANTPIVKFYHLPTKTHCDVSFKTTLGVQNSKLIRFLLSVDPRLIPLAVVLKYWASVHELSGTGRLSNYALTMMLIFYLQQPPAPVLPSVCWLQRDPAVAHTVDDWNTGIATDPALLPPNDNASTLAELIGGFFSFYAQFNFEEHVVCPFLGRTFQKSLFRDPSRLPEEFVLYKANVNAGCPPVRHSTPFCVQDPFEQCHNVASGVSSRFAGDVIRYFKFAAEAYEAEKGRECKDFLRKILLERPPLARPRGKAEFRVTLHPSGLAGVPPEGWRGAVEDAVRLIFETMLQLKLEPVNKVNRPGDDSPHPKNPKRIKYTGVITRAIWKRKQFSKLYSAMRLGLCDRERSITQEILATNNNVLDISFQLTITFIDGQRGLVLTVRSRAPDLQTFREFGKFFRSVTAHWFNVLVKKDHSNKLPTPSASTTDYEDSKPVDGNDDNENGIDDVTDSDSDSTEDERTPDVQTEFTETNEQSDGEKSPSDTDKENVEETNNVDGKIAPPNNPQGSKTQNDKTKNNTNKRNSSKKSQRHAATQGEEMKRRSPQIGEI